MSIHVCKQCGLRFEYCRACVFRPIRYKDQGFCSKECYEASKNNVVEIVEPEIIEEVVFVEEIKIPDEIIEVPSVEDEIEAEAVASEENITMETIEVAEPTIKKETNTYKKKKNKYK